ncbi:PAS domain-containing protein [Desulfovibrio cuneatus]|uniref:PAS domain-containing protein n=1 Tax=Desulfovibrio cuneatus TaxID=159728 RepID=UPI000400FBB8|nr:PAS domain-containing protein [Desulfovibrio cuneatus]
MNTQQAHHSIMPPPGIAKRAFTLCVIIATYVAVGGWFFFTGERDALIQDTKVRLWSETRAVVNQVALWHAPIHQQGEVFAAMDIVKIFMTHAGPSAGSATEITLPVNDAQRQAMAVYLQRFATRVQATQALLVTLEGKVAASGVTPTNDNTQTAVDTQFNTTLLAAKLTEGVPFDMPVRMGSTGPLLDVVFPVYAAGSADGSLPLAGGLLLTFNLAAPLQQWLETPKNQQIETLILERHHDELVSLTPTGTSPLATLYDVALPGGDSPQPSSSKTSFLTDFAGNTLATFWRTAPAAQGNLEQDQFAAAMRIPQMNSWFIVKKIPSQPVDASLKAIAIQTIFASIAAGLFLFVMLVMRWWWLDGRRQKNTQKLLLKAHSHLSLHQQVLATISAFVSEGVCAINNKGIILYVNPACAAMLELPEGSIIGKELYSLLRTPQVRVHKDADMTVLHGKQVTPFTDIWTHTHTYIQQKYTVYKIPLRGQEGTAYGVITIFALSQETNPKN